MRKLYHPGPVVPSADDGTSLHPKVAVKLSLDIALKLIFLISFPRRRAFDTRGR